MQQLPPRLNAEQVQDCRGLRLPGGQPVMALQALLCRLHVIVLEAVPWDVCLSA